MAAGFTTKEEKRIAESICTVCTKPIGYDRRFYETKQGTKAGNYVDQTYAHAICLDGKSPHLIQ